MIEVTLPIRTPNPSNGSQFSWTKVRQRKQQRGTACIMTKVQLNRQPQLFSYPIIVTLIRVSAGELDSDGLQAALKSVRDGIADAFGEDDSERSRLRFVYQQEKCKRGAFGVKVRIE